MYGIADAGFGIADTDTPGSDSTTMVYTGVQSSSRFGIRGSEDIGSGLKVTGVYANGPFTVQAYFQSSESANAAATNTVDRDE